MSVCAILHVRFVLLSVCMCVSYNSINPNCYALAHNQIPLMLIIAVNSLQLIFTCVSHFLVGFTKTFYMRTFLCVFKYLFGFILPLLC